jgi:DNA-directed RNA polymerase alpha subunit
MNPSISKISVDDELYQFTLSGINVSLANALRRTILSDIPTTVIYTEVYKDNQCNIEINTSRLHNEIIKQRLSCIPVHVTELDLLPDNYILEVDVTNESDSIIYVTTEDFRIKNKTNDNYLTVEETRRIFPACPKTNSYIDFVRLRPTMGNLPGEQLKLTANFSVHNAKENSMFNVVSTCSYGNTVDMDKANTIWTEYENKLKSESASVDDIKMQRTNFYLLDAHRHFVENSYDYCIQSVGVYKNQQIVKLACKILIDKLADMIVAIDSDIVPIRPSETTMANSFDIILENEDYTLGKLLEFVIYNKYFESEEILSFCGFKKFHPHDDESIIRLAYVKPSDKNMVRTHMKNACELAKETYEKINKMF